jgi:hypothetical protein
VALLAALACTEARAERLRMLVLVGGEQHRELAARIKGQTADLDAVVATAEGTLPRELDAQLAVARAARSRADVVVWFDAAPSGDWIAYIARGDRVLVRRIAVAPGALSRSASIEAVALAVRTALTGFAAARDADEDDRSRPVGFRAWGELGWSGLADGTGAPGRHGASLRLGAARGRWHLAGAFGLQQSTAVHAGAASIVLERLGAGLLVGADLVVSPRAAPTWTVALQVGLGAVRYRRVTDATGAGLVPTASTATWSPVISPGLRAARRVRSGTWLAVEAGADVLLRAPEFGVERTTGFDRVASVWACQPRVALSLLLDWR